MDQLADLIERENEAFVDFRDELRRLAKRLGSIEDPVEYAQEARKAAERLGREQVDAVEQKMREAKRARHWDTPIVIAQLTAGAFPLIAAIVSNAPHLMFASSAVSAAINALIAAGKTVQKQKEYKALPGYFLWQLERGQGS